MPLFRRRREEEEAPIEPPSRGFDWFKDKKPTISGGSL